MNILFIILAAIVLLGPLIAIHEFGHFWVARRMGVKVLVYSIGFGPTLLKWHGKDGVCYQIAAIPLGGYVRMADEREGEVAPEDIPYAFNRQSAWRRMAIVAAGPGINLLFAILLFWILFLPASEQLNTRIGQVQANSPAAQAGLLVGDRITAIDGQQAQTWESLNYALVERMGETGTIQVTAERNQQLHHFNVPIEQFMRNGNQTPLEQLGFFPYQPEIAPVIGDLSSNEPAEQQGLKVGDRIVQINQQPVKQWMEVTRIVRANPEKPLTFSILRDSKPLELQLTPKAKRDAVGSEYGFLGAGAKIENYKIPTEYTQTIQYSPLTALFKAVDKTWQLSVMTVKAMGKMISGLIGLDNLSGPITIAKVAGQSAEMGWQAFFSFMALMSVSLGILNLLPIPVLDGGHLVYYFIEALRGKPVSEQIQMVGLRIGIVLLGALMILALFNDFARLI
ncbi:RIP metalloprotease RseP [Alkanindiges sp. WGS2144]|uniref:RIP metalloprotease RseP n=1 Tax=Alkanindiges sp. WGS2144 TaxID=3366808 RepID=UPI0037511B14